MTVTHLIDRLGNYLQIQAALLRVLRVLIKLGFFLENKAGVNFFSRQSRVKIFHIKC